MGHAHHTLFRRGVQREFPINSDYERRLEHVEGGG